MRKMFSMFTVKKYLRKKRVLLSLLFGVYSVVKFIYEDNTSILSSLLVFSEDLLRFLSFSY